MYSKTITHSYELHSDNVCKRRLIVFDTKCQHCIDIDTKRQGSSSYVFLP